MNPSITKEENKEDDHPVEYLALIESTYEKLKQRYGTEFSFKDLFTVDDQVDQIEKVVGDLSETMKHGNQ